MLENLESEDMIEDDHQKEEVGWKYRKKKAGKRLTT
jgi:hypothetical protein